MIAYRDCHSCLIAYSIKGMDWKRRVLVSVLACVSNPFLWLSMASLFLQKKNVLPLKWFLLTWWFCSGHITCTTRLYKKVPWCLLLLKFMTHSFQSAGFVKFLSEAKRFLFLPHFLFSCSLILAKEVVWGNLLNYTDEIMRGNRWSWQSH